MALGKSLGETFIDPVKKDWEKAKKGDAEGIAMTAANVLTGGAASSLGSLASKGIQAVEDINKQVTPAEQAPLTRAYTEEEKSKLRGDVKSLQDYVPTAYDTSKLQSGATQGAALGQALVDQTVTIDPSQAALARTLVAAAPTRQVAGIDRSNLEAAPTIDKSLAGNVQFDAASIPTNITFDQAKVRSMQLYPGDPNAQQQYLMNTLQTQAEGGGPSVAAAQFQAANEANLAASLAQQASLRGGFDPAAARNIRQTAADLQAQAARDAAQARIQEQMNAQTQLANVASTTEQQRATAGQQSIAGAQTDIETQKAVTAAQEATAQQTLAVASEAARIAGGNEERKMQLENMAVEAALTARGQEVQLAQTAAQLEDAAFRDQFQGQLETNLKQADLTSVETRVEFDAKMNILSNNMMATNQALAQAYNGNVAFLQNDIQAANDLIVMGIQQGMSLKVLEKELEAAFIEDGRDAETAAIMAKNAFNAAMTARAQAIIDGQNAIRKQAYSELKEVSQTVAKTGAELGMKAATGGMGGLPSLGGAAASPSGALPYGDEYGDGVNASNTPSRSMIS